MNVNPPQAASPYVFDASQSDFEEKVLLASMRTPVLVDFWAAWCGPCKQLGPILERVVASYNGQVLLAKVDTDREQQLAALFGIRSLPTVLLLRDGRPVDGFVGAQPEGAIRELLEAHLGAPADNLDDEAPMLEDAPPAPLDPAEKVAALRAQLAAEPDDATRLELAKALAEAGEVDEARALLDALPANLGETDLARKVRSRLSIVGALKDAPAQATLEQRVAQDPKDLRARHQLGVRLLLAGRDEAALDQFLEIMRTDRGFDEDLGRRTLVAAFDLIEDADLVSRTRRKMSALLF